jgi:hypothetical protein
MNCMLCGEPAKLVDRKGAYRRGDRKVEIVSKCWSCPNSCTDFDGQDHFEFYDASQLRANDEEAKRVWMETWKEPMPKSPFPAKG